jgi:hypothetical protein
MSSTRTGLCLLAAIVGIGGPGLGKSIADTLAAWTTVGAVGTPDEVDAQKIAFYNDGSVGIRSSVTGASAKVRYNVVATRDVTALIKPFDDSEFELPLDFSATFLDNGPRARVIATLKRMDMDFGPGGSETTTLAVIDSDAEANDTPSLYTRHLKPVRWNGRPVSHLGFYTAAYFVEVQLIKSATGGDPRIRALSIFHDDP